MSIPFIGEIKMVASNFAPRGWAFCDGQLLNVSEHQALFALLGTTYGGDGRTTFALPDLRGRLVMHEGTGPGLTSRRLGAKGGAEIVTLTTNEMPAHNHTVACVSSNGNQGSPVGNLPGAEPIPRADVWSNAAADGTMRATMIGNTGGTRPHTNIQPYQVVHYIIAIEGIFPSRN